MTNLDILKKYTKTEILTILIKFLINSYAIEEAEEYAEHILWLFEEVQSTAKFWFFKEEFYEEINEELPFEDEKEEQDV